VSTFTNEGGKVRIGPMAAVIHMSDTEVLDHGLDHQDEVTWFAHGDEPEEIVDVDAAAEALTARRRSAFAALADL
jgi:hypothetical protein